MAYGQQDERELGKGRPLTRFKLIVKRASAGLGLFAGEPIPKGAKVIEYSGRMLNQEEYAKSRSVYLFDIGPSGALDGSPRWNTARYINHSCRPNCYPDVSRKRVFIYAKRNIKEGEELGYDYGHEYFDAYIGKNCRCVKCAPPQTAKAKKQAKTAAAKRAPARQASARQTAKQAGKRAAAKGKSRR